MMGMSMERWHLAHLQQILGALEAVVLGCFGPHGGRVLFIRETGQVKLSRCGADILGGLRLDHPVARMIEDLASTHSAGTGDGSKTFILLLAALVRGIHTTASKNPHVSQNNSTRNETQYATARRLANELLSFALQKLDDIINVGVVPYGQCLSWQDFSSATTSPVQKLLSSFFRTRLGHSNISFICSLLCEMLVNWKSNNNLPLSTLEFLNDMFPALYTPVEGFPISCCRLIDGQVIHRDFATSFTQINQDSVKAIVFNGPIDPGFQDAERTLEVGGKQNISDFSSHNKRTLESVIEHIGRFGVNVLLSSDKLSAAVLSLTTQAQICVVECISEEELSLFSHLSGAMAISEYWTIQSKHVVPLAFCKPIVLGAHRYVHVGFPEKEHFKPCSLVICGTREGQTEQHASALEDALQMLQTTWEPPTFINFSQGCMIPAGGTFEFLLRHALQKRSVSKDTDPAVFHILADSLNYVSRHIYSRNPRLLAQTRSEVLKYIQKHGAFPIHCHCNTPVESTNYPCRLQSDLCILESGLESVSSKYQTLMAALHCLAKLFQIDSIHYTHTRLKTIRCRYVFSRGTEDSEDSDEEDEN